MYEGREKNTTMEKKPERNTKKVSFKAVNTPFNAHFILSRETNKTTKCLKEHKLLIPYENALPNSKN
jgi:hypothetical protein